MLDWCLKKVQIVDFWYLIFHDYTKVLYNDLLNIQVSFQPAWEREVLPKKTLVTDFVIMQFQNRVAKIKAVALDLKNEFHQVLSTR